MMSNPPQNQYALPPLSNPCRFAVVGVSFLLVAFGQPAWLPWFGIIAAVGGYALLFRVLLDIPSNSRRFGLAFLWFFAVQLVQASWFLSHPFWYIYGVYFFIATWLGLQFGCIGLLIHPKVFQGIPNLFQNSARSKCQLLNHARYIHATRPLSILKAIGYASFVAAVWTVLEWSRLFLLSGLSWNPSGLALTSNIYAMQMVSLWGIFGLSFWVLFVNILGLNAWVFRKSGMAFTLTWLVAAAIPYLYGMVHLAYHKGEAPQSLTTMLVQTALPVERGDVQKKGIIQSVIDEWRQILLITARHQKQAVDLIVLPEYVVSFGTYSYIYPLNEVMAAFIDVFHPKSLDFFPEPNYPFAAVQMTGNGVGLFVNNAYWIQSLSNYFQADVVSGLEDAEEVTPGVIEHYSAAHFTHPQNTHPADSLFAVRYAKRVLVPMGEYIPFSFCKEIAQRYGIFGSFTCGQEAIVMTSHGVPFSPSICYEETYGDIISEGRQKGARLLVNMTNDAWYPGSKLPQQHFDHARIRSVENGVPLVRACNTGITGAVDSFGRTLALLGGEHPEKVEWVPDALVVNVPINTYSTPYALFGDKLIIGLSLLVIGIGIVTSWRFFRAAGNTKF